MKRHAKAPSSGSSTRQASRLGAVIRGAFATRIASSHADGSGAPARGQSGAARPRLLLALTFAIATALVLGVALASAAPQVVTINDATNVTYSTADVSGTVDPADHDITACYFDFTTDEYYQAYVAEGRDGFFESSIDYPCDVELSELTAGAGSEPVAATFFVDPAHGGLLPATLYHFRLVTENSEGERVEARSTLTTLTPTPPELRNLQITDLTATFARFSAEVEPTGADPAFDAVWSFECVPDCHPLPAFGSVSGSPQVVHTSAHLHPNTEYTVIVKVRNSGGTREESTTFTTPATPPTATTGTNTLDPEGGGVTVRGYVDPRGSQVTDCRFEFGTSTAYGEEAPCEGHPGNEVQLLKIIADGGQFRLTYKGQETADLPFDATAAEVQATLIALAAIDPGDATVTGGPTSPTPDKRYRIAFAGLLADTDVPELQVGDGTQPLCGGAAPNCEPHKGSYTSIKTLIPGGLFEPLPVAAHLTGLAPGTTYHFRLVAETASGEGSSPDGTFNAAEEAEDETCSNEALRTEQHSRALPGCRAYEMVSPAEKNGQFVMRRSDRVRVATDCLSSCAATFDSTGSFPGSEGTGGTLASYMSLRQPGAGGSGWVTHSINPYQDPTPFPISLQTAGPAYEGDFSPDLDTAVYRSFSSITDDPYTEKAANLYTRSGLRGSTPSSQPLTTCPICETDTHEPLPGWNYSGEKVPTLAGHSADFQHVLFTDPQDLTGNGAGTNLYRSDAGKVSLVGLVPPGSESSCAGAACDLPSPPHAVPGSGRSPLHTNTLSEDGSRVNFVAPIDPNHSPLEPDTLPTQLYQRDSHGTASTTDDTTVLISASERQSPEPAQDVGYQTASADGHRVFFTSFNQLTDDAPQGTHLYLWHDDYLNDEVQRLTVSATAGQFRLLLAAQETGDLPFDASEEEVAEAIEALPAVDSAGGTIKVVVEPGQEADSSIYTITFEGGLTETDRPTMTTAPGTTPLSGGAATATVDPRVMGGGHLTLIDVDREPADPGIGGLQGVIGASDDGSYLYFTSHNQLDPGKPSLSDEGLFLWHDGEVHFIASAWPAGSLVANENSVQNIFPLSRVSSDGKTLLIFADNSTGLTGYDSNCEGRICPQFYVYHAESDSLACISCSPQGEPGETVPALEEYGGIAHASRHLIRALADGGRFAFFNTAQALLLEDTNGVLDAYEFDTATGEVHLLSTGTSPKPSFFTETSPDGHDVFIVTAQALLGWDTDDVNDLYDLRVDGGFPEPAQSPDACSGEGSCRAAPAAPPAPGSAASEHLTGPENPKPQPCKKHRVRRHGRCVAKKKPQHRAHQRRGRNERGGRK